ncbi:MAG: hypothetical protein Q8874_02620 [Sweet potato little leaf phytoplasma]|nr:hypothetical protein [Sweet potato little leaf phytoplasma]
MFCGTVNKESDSSRRSERWVEVVLSTIDVENIIVPRLDVSNKKQLDEYNPIFVYLIQNGKHYKVCLCKREHFIDDHTQDYNLTEMNGKAWGNLGIGDTVELTLEEEKRLERLCFKIKKKDQ